MQSRRINIDGNRYLIFYTFADEPWLDVAATVDATATSAQPHNAEAPVVAQPNNADSPSVSVIDDQGRTVSPADQSSTGEECAKRSEPHAEGKQDV